jgi:hypothetical protein
MALGRNAPGPWPLKPGEYSVYYLLNDGYKVAGRADFTIRG